MNGTKDWTFKDADLAQNFDNHVREQLPWYDMATKAVAFLCRNYVPKNGTIYDIGASTGNISKSITSLIAERNIKFIAIEESQEIAKKYGGFGRLIIDDATKIDYEPFDLAIFFLSFMFIERSVRGNFLDSLIHKCKHGGAIVMLEKMETTGGNVGTIIRKMTINNKLENGVSPDEIIKKELSLCGVQRAVSTSELPANAVEFFRMGEFAGYIMEKK